MLTKFFEEILIIFQSGETAGNEAQEKTLIEVENLVSIMKGRPYSTDNNQIYAAFERIKPYLPEEATDPEELRIVCNTGYMARVMVSDGKIDDWTPKISSYSPLIKKKIFWDPDAWKRGLRDFKKFGGGIVGPGEAEFFSH